ncbi:MAG: hypothetical protein AAFX99_20380 [Myxococcota bacterium]
MVSRFELYSVVSIVLCLVFGLQAVADQDPTTDQVPRLMPYSGILELDGQAVTATGNNAPWIRFELRDGVQDAAPVVLRQDAQVDVRNGRFHVVLGENDRMSNYVQSGDLSTAVVGADALYLRIILLGEHDPESPSANAGDDVVLSNAQRLLMSPYALWATHATNFEVANNLNVANDLNVADNLNVRGNIANSSGNVVVRDNLIMEEGSLRLAPGDGNSRGLNFGTSSDTAWIRFSGNGLSNGSDLEIGVSDDNTDRIALVAPGGVRVSSSLNVSGNISGNFQMSVSNETSLTHSGTGRATSSSLGNANGRRFCFLTRAGNEETDSGDEYARCHVVVTGGQWRLRAELRSNASDTVAFCGARCVSW